MKIELDKNQISFIHFMAVIAIGEYKRRKLVLPELAESLQKDIDNFIAVKKIMRELLKGEEHVSEYLKH